MTGKHVAEEKLFEPIELEEKGDPNADLPVEGEQSPHPGTIFSSPEGVDPKEWAVELAGGLSRLIGIRHDNHVLLYLLEWALIAHEEALRHDERSAIAGIIRNTSFQFNDEPDLRRLVAASVRARDSIANFIDPHSTRS